MNKSSTTVDNGLVLKLKTNKENYRLKESVKITLILTNKMDKDVTLNFSSSQRYDIVIKKEDEEIWKWSKDRMFATVMGNLTISPNESKLFKVDWGQQNNDGDTVSDGRYIITGIIKSFSPLVSKSVSIEVNGKGHKC